MFTIRQIKFLNCIIRINIIEFKLLPGDLLMMDNYRLLHGRTSFNANEGNRFLQGCYIDYDSTEGKIKHLKRSTHYINYLLKQLFTNIAIDIK